MNKKPLNYSKLFNLYSDNQKNSKDIMIQNIGKVSFFITFFTSLVYGVVGESFFEQHKAYRNVLIGLFGISFLTGILIFIHQGIKYIGQENNQKSYAKSFITVIGKVFLYLILPALIISLLLVAITYSK